MNIAIGFGVCELEAARKIIDECIDEIREADAMREDDAFFAAARRVHDKYQAAADAFDKMDRADCPGRYTRPFIHAHRLWDGRVYVTICMHHINRRHPFSPGGWAMWRREYALDIDFSERGHTRVFSEADL